MDANTLLVTAEKQLTQALYNYQQSIIQLKRVAGVLLKTIEEGQTTGKELNK